MARTSQRPLPLTHHDILGLVRPFVARGFHVDLEASDRQTRRLAFKPKEIADGSPAVLDTLTLLARERHSTLTRTVTDPQGLSARIHAEGAEVPDLVAAVMAVSPHDLFGEVDAVRIAEHWAGSNISPTSASWRLSGAEALTGPVRINVNAESMVSGLVDISLTPIAELDPAPELPDDLLAVLGRAWRPIRKADGIWRSAIRIHRKRDGRDAEVRQKLQRTVAHLSQTFSHPPERFHIAHGAARRAVMIRRAIPLAVCVSVPILTLAAGWLFSSMGGAAHPLLLSIPELMLVAGMVVAWREVPVIELPPRPRPIPSQAWQPSPPSPSVS
jgi:hypothetical protein